MSGRSGRTSPTSKARRSGVGELRPPRASPWANPNRNGPSSPVPAALQSFNVFGAPPRHVMFAYPCHHTFLTHMPLEVWWRTTTSPSDPRVAASLVVQQGQRVRERTYGFHNNVAGRAAIGVESAKGHGKAIHHTQTTSATMVGSSTFAGEPCSESELLSLRLAASSSYSTVTTTWRGTSPG